MTQTSRYFYDLHMHTSRFSACSAMNPEEAMQAAVDVRARVAVGMHYGTFDLTDEPLDEPPRRFHAAGSQHALDGVTPWTMQIGETRQW